MNTLEYIIVRHDTHRKPEILFWLYTVLHHARLIPVTRAAAARSIERFSFFIWLGFHPLFLSKSPLSKCNKKSGWSSSKSNAKGRNSASFIAIFCALYYVQICIMYICTQSLLTCTCHRFISHLRICAGHSCASVYAASHSTESIASLITSYSGKNPIKEIVDFLSRFKTK